MSDYFIVEVPIYTSPHAYRVLKRRFNVAHHMYNSFLSECEKRRKIYLNSLEYSQAKECYIQIDKLNTELSKLKKEQKNEKNKLKDQLKIIKIKQSDLFEQARIKSGFYPGKSAPKNRLNSLECFAARVTKEQWLSEHIDSHTRNKLMNRAFKCSEESMNPKKRSSNGSHAKVRFKPFDRDPLMSLEGKSMKSSIRLKLIDGKIYFSWSGLVLPLNVYDKDNNVSDIKWKQALVTDGENWTYAKYVRIKRKRVKHRWHYSIQLSCQGKPVQKKEKLDGLGKGVIGMDIGPSIIAYVSDSSAELRLISEELLNSNLYKNLILKRKKLERQLSRQQIKNNPWNFEKNGTVKPRSQRRRWVNSKRMLLVRRRLNDMHRRLKETRKCNFEILAWKLRRQGDIIQIDKDQYKPWQKICGKSMEMNAPSLFVEVLKRTFESTGGEVVFLDTRKTKSSQTCPNCRKVEKKGVKEGKDSRSIRMHDCECGFRMQRDLTSALYNKFVNKETCECDVDKSSQFIMEKEPLLRDGITKNLQSPIWAKRKQHPSFGKRTELEEIVRNVN